MAANANTNKWKSFKQEVTKKRCGAEKECCQGFVDNCSKNESPTDRQTENEPERTRDFVEFSQFQELSLENVNKACCNFYGKQKAPVMCCLAIEIPLASKMTNWLEKKLFW